MLDSVHSKMGFTFASELAVDAERSELKRAPTQPLEEATKEHYNFVDCEFHDWQSPNAPTLDIETMGFDTIDLSGMPTLQGVLENIRQEKHMSQADVSAIRKSLGGASFKLSNGKRLRLLYIASEGLILRKAGPDLLDANEGEKITGTNGHGGAEMLHGDQDVFGSPLSKIMGGAAPWIFRHNTPDGKNKHSPFFLLNLWIPLDQVTRPLTLMDRTTLNNQEHQIRYALPTDGDAAQEVIDKTFGGTRSYFGLTKVLKKIVSAISQVDIWLFLPDAKQKFYFSANMDSKRAYAFDTLGMPHGAFILPGENVAKQCYLQLQSASEAIEKGDVQILKEVTQPQAVTLPTETTEPLRLAISKMLSLLEEAQLDAEQLAGKKKGDWLDRAEAAMSAVVRKSIEVRTVGIVTPF